MGSKNRIAKDILPIILKNRKTGQLYVEPFVGGCNTFDKVVDCKLGNDNNKSLIAMWETLLSGWIPPKYISKKHYNYFKQSENYDALKGYIGFNCSYSGKWFGGYAGKVKTKIGTIRDYQLEAYNNIMKQVKNFKSSNLTAFCCKEYYNIILPSNCIIYCDPPYANTTKYKDKFNHPEFWNWCRKENKRGNEVFISEYNAPDDFECIWEKEVKSSLSANGIIGGNKNSIERLFKKIT